MTTPLVRAATASDESRAVDVIVLAFSSDPVVRWFYPDAHQYLTNFPAFVRAFGGKAFAQGTAYYVEGYPGAALWLPPDVHPDVDAVVALIQRTVHDRKQENLFAIFEQMGAFHPTEPHWYLPLIGVDPAHQNKGHGSALLKHALVPCDRDNKIAYLESSNPANISLYERHGFELLGTIEVGTAPPVFPMLRRPR